jgi:hypothetical protein
MTESPKHDSIQPLGSPESLMDGVSGPRTQVPDDMVLLLVLLFLYCYVSILFLTKTLNISATPVYQGRLARSFKGHHSDIVWSGVAWKCGKQLKHYPAFCRNGITIAVSIH